ncbi:hypothetical protein LEM8419_00144 [Neolewinella maritima]|uniref:DUF2569 domain-containing protein n=1 Tax=Neolewinella maritima TaxID=1383882 RepID=A0ABM9AVY5_9BACT|nr:hypothetical protein [Neolewinella maritima]CAH0998828.1 hypothetical protein LEM8419_00144 [Neolewinella maritima]
MTTKTILTAWLTTIVLGSLLFFPSVGLLNSLTGGYGGAEDWDLLEMLYLSIWPAGFSFACSLPALVALLITRYVLHRRGLSAMQLLLATLKAQLLFAVCTFTYIFATEGTDEMYLAAALLYIPIGSLSLIGFGLRHLRPRPSV